MKISPLPYIGQFDPNSIPTYSFSPFISHTVPYSHSLLEKKDQTRQRNIVIPFSSPTANDPLCISQIEVERIDQSTEGRQVDTPSWIESPEQEVQWNYFPDQETLTETNDDSLELNDEEDPSPPNSASGIVGLSPTPLYNVSLFHQTEDSWISSLIYGYKWW